MIKFIEQFLSKFTTSAFKWSCAWLYLFHSTSCTWLVGMSHVWSCPLKLVLIQSSAPNIPLLHFPWPAVSTVWRQTFSIFGACPENWNNRSLNVVFQVFHYRFCLVLDSNTRLTSVTACIQRKCGLYESK